MSTGVHQQPVFLQTLGNNATFLTGVGNLETTNFQNLNTWWTHQQGIYLLILLMEQQVDNSPLLQIMLQILGASGSARFRNLFLGPGSLHIQCTIGDGCGQTLDYTIGVISSGTGKDNLVIGANGVSNNKSFLTVGQTGNVGIGTSTPSQNLHIFANSNSSIGARIENTNNGASAFAQLELKGNTKQYNLGVGSSGTASFPGSFYIYDNGANTPRLIINQLGFTGIGTEVPLQLEMADWL